MKSLRSVVISLMAISLLLSVSLICSADNYKGGHYSGGGGHYYGSGHYYGGGHHYGRGYYYGPSFGISFGAPWYYPYYYPYYSYNYPYYYPYYYAPAVTIPSEPQEYIEKPRAGEQPAPSGVWYYCPDSKKYYPYVKECPGGWQTVPAQPTSEPRR